MKRNVYDYAPSENNGNEEFVEMFDNLPIGELEERTDLERAAKMVWIVNSMYDTDDKEQEDYTMRLIIGHGLIHGYDESSYVNFQEDVLCICQAHNVLYPKGHTKEIKFTEQELEDIQFVKECILEHTANVKKDIEKLEQESKFKDKE